MKNCILLILMVVVMMLTSFKAFSQSNPRPAPGHFEYIDYEKAKLNIGDTVHIFNADGMDWECLDTNNFVFPHCIDRLSYGKGIVMAVEAKRGGDNTPTYFYVVEVCKGSSDFFRDNATFRTFWKSIPQQHIVFFHI